MHVRPNRFVALAVTIGLTAVASGCGNAPRPVAATSSVPAPSEFAEPGSELVARAAAAKDRRFIAGYSLTRGGRRTQAVMVTVAEDGAWRADVTGGALGGAADIALIGRPDGLYQCALSGAPAGCVQVAGPDEDVPASIDPQVQHPFTDWLDILTDPSVAITVTVADTLPGAAGTCYTVEPTTVTLAPPIKAAVFCYTPDGTLTAVRAGFGTLTLTGTPAPPPATVNLPGVVVDRAPLPLAAPPPPPPASTSRPAGGA